MVSALPNGADPVPVVESTRLMRPLTRTSRGAIICAVPAGSTRRGGQRRLTGIRSTNRPFIRPIVFVNSLSSVAQPVPVSSLAETERRVFAKIGWRLMPLLILSYILNYLDRTNVSFAALTMNDALGLTRSSSDTDPASSFWATASSSCPAIWCCIASGRASGSRAS